MRVEDSPREVSERFWEQIDRNDPNGCWIWTGSHTAAGYGRFLLPRDHWGDMKNWHGVYAHRFMWEWENGPISEGLQIDHLCKNHPCVNPDHMEVVTLLENIRRGDSPQAINARKTHCKRGHPLSGDNLYTKPTSKGRECRACRKQGYKDA